MRYKIIGDSCMDMPEELRRDPHFSDDSADASGG